MTPRRFCRPRGPRMTAMQIEIWTLVYELAFTAISLDALGRELENDDDADFFEKAVI